MDWENIELNSTEKRLQENVNLFSEYKENLYKFVKENYEDLLLQAGCSLQCLSCSGHKVLECWWDNKTKNTLKESQDA